MDLGWTLRRYAHLARRLMGSVAIRGWRATLRRALKTKPKMASLGPGSFTAEVRAPAPSTRARRILVIEQMTPDPTRDSGSLRLCRIFSLLNADGWTIDFIADDNDASSSDIQQLASLGVRVHAGSPSQWLAAHGSLLDAAMLCRLPVADQYLPLIRRWAPRARAVFDTVDLHFIRERRAAELTASSALVRRANRSRHRELSVVRRSDVTIVVSEDERQVLVDEAPGAQVEVVSNIHDIAEFINGFGERQGLLFVGGFGHPPNEDAVRWFIAEVFPYLRAHDPSMMFHVVGDIEDDARASLEHDGVVVHGRVQELTSLMDHVRLSVAPLRFGAGVKGKVNQAMSHGLPVVLTTIAAEGMHLTSGVDALVEDDAPRMAEAIMRAYTDSVLWERLSEGGQANVRHYFSPELARAALRATLEGPAT